MNLQLKTGEELFLVLIMGLLLIFSLVILFIVITLFIQVRHILEGVDPQAVPSEPFWKKWFNNAVPTTQEETILLDHNYDGIRELDNHLPPWWIGLFYGTIVFGILYLANYHFWRWSPLQDDEYSQEMAAAKIEVEKFQAKQANSISETNVTLLTDEAGISKGKEIFTANLS